MTILSDLGRSAPPWRSTAEPRAPQSRSSAHSAVALAMSAACCLLGCGRDAPPLQKERGIRDSNGNLMVYPVTTPPPKAAKPAPPAPRFGSSSFGRSPTPTPPPAATALVDAGSDADAGDAEPERDLAAELSTALASVHNCVDLSTAAQQRDGRLVISVSAYVMGSGRISRLTVTAPGQPAAAITCMQRQALSLTLRDPVPGAPINVKGTTELQVKNIGGSADAAAPSPIPVAPTQPLVPGNPNIAQPNADDMARPDTESMAGPPQ